jgi:hypothetical protein
MSIFLRFISFTILPFLLISCVKKEREVFDGDEKIYISLDGRTFNVPKKYIDGPSKSVPQKLIFNKDQGMITYYYWPTLDGLSENDDQPRFGRINHSIIQMEWTLLSSNPVPASKFYENVTRLNEMNPNTRDCHWNGIVKCRYAKDSDFAKWIGYKENVGYFFIRCPANNSKVLEDEICNFSFDYEAKGLSINGFIGSKFVLKGDNVPKILDQSRSFLDQWETH